MTLPIIGWTIAAGNPREGFSMYGFFANQAEASQSAEEDRTLGFDWWILPIYSQEAQP